MMNLVDSFNFLLFWTQVSKNINIGKPVLIAHHLRNVLVFFSYHLLKEIIFIIFGHTTWCVGSLFTSWGLILGPLQWTCGVLTTGMPGNSHLPLYLYSSLYNLVDMSILPTLIFCFWLECYFCVHFWAIHLQII